MRPDSRSHPGAPPLALLLAAALTACGGGGAPAGGGPQDEAPRTPAEQTTGGHAAGGANGTVGLLDEPEDPGPPCVRTLAAEVGAMAVVSLPAEDEVREEVLRIPCEQGESDEACLTRTQGRSEAEGDDREVELTGEAGGVTATLLVDDEEMVRTFPSTHLLVSFMQAESNAGRRIVLHSMEQAFDPGTRAAVVRRVRTLAEEERRPRAILVVEGAPDTVAQRVESAAETHGIEVEEVAPLGDTVRVSVVCR